MSPEAKKSGNGAENQANRPPISGLDMAPTIEWYASQQEELTRMLPTVGGNRPFRAENTNHFNLSESRTTAAISLFPTNAIARSRLQTGTIIGKPALYFSKEAIPEDIQTTSNPSDALSPTAIIPSYTDNKRWIDAGELSSDIWLFEIPNDISPAVAEIIHTQGLVHEFAHTIVTQTLYQENYQLRLPNGNIVNAYDYVIAFASAAEKHDPISHYSSFYGKPGEEFKSLLGIEEEIVETIAAHLLGFVYCDNPDRRFIPLSDRPEITTMVDNFLNAELIS